MIELSTSRNPKAGVGRINTTRSTNQAVGNRNNDVYVGSISPHMNSHHTSISDHEVQGILQDVDRNVYVGGASSNGLPTCLSSSTRWFQLVMFAMFLIALCFAMFSKYENLSPGLIWGAILSCFSVIFVIVSYVSVPNYRQHPNPLMFWRTIADAIFVCQLLTQQFVRCVFYECQPLCNTKNLQCGCSMASTAGETCTIFAGLFEFSLLAAECWFFCMTLNLLVSLTNPFTDFKRNTKLFHLFCWGFPLVLGILLLTVPNFAGYSDLGVCWTNALRKLPADPKFSCGPNDDVLDNFADNYKPVNANILSWVFFYVWMGIFILFGIVVWIWVWKRLSEGMPETYAVRVQSIQRARFNVMAVTSYWIVVGIIYIQFLSRNRFDVDPLISELLNFVIAAKGYLDLVIWFALNDFQWKHFTIHCWNSKELQDVDIDLNPQVNAALRKEVLFYTTSGIIQAVLAAERLPASQRIQHLALLPQTKSTNTTITNTTTTPTTTTNTTTRSTGPTLPVPSSSSSSTMANDYYYAPQDTQYPQSPPVFDTTMRTALPPLPCRPPPLSSSSSPKSSSSSSQRTKTFHDYEPHAFKKIRERFGVNNEAYIESLSTTAKERLSEGASGAFMFFSSDGALIVKSTSKEECFFLRSIANQYADYLCANEKTLLTRFYGCHCLELYGKSFFFVVMANFFDTKQIIHSRYDIKGSWVNRHGELPKRSKKVTCLFIKA
jgi:1-phosphatidylinositol-4-phosphate 5-kinase